MEYNKRTFFIEVKKRILLKKIRVEVNPIDKFLYLSDLAALPTDLRNKIVSYERK